MNHLNSLIIEGNIVRQGELSEPMEGFKVCKFPVAVDRWYKNKDGNGVTEVSYFEVETYGRMAEFCSTQATKGRGVRVVGRLKQDRWKDTDNKNQSKTYIVAEHVEYKPKFQNNSESGENNGGKSESNIKKETAAPAEAQTSEEQQSEMVEEAVF